MEGQNSDSDPEQRYSEMTEKKAKKSSKSKREHKNKESRKEQHDHDSQPKKELAPSKKYDKSEQQPTLWDIALDTARRTAAVEGSQLDEKSIMFVGSRDAGKTTAILRFLDRDEAPKPTTALEYTFGRKAKGNNLDKDVGHIWELGGGTWLSKLSNITISPDTIKNMTVALVLDLSKLNELWTTLEKWLEVLRAQVDAAIMQARGSDGSLKDRLQASAWERVGSDHPDREMIDPFLLPLVIIGAKYDVFQDFDPEKRKVICKTLRFVAHRNGAHLQFFSTKHETLLSKARQIISSFVFGTPLSKMNQVDHNKPIMVSAGQDTLSQIGTPPLPEGDLGRVTARTPMDLWKGAFTAHFPQESLADPKRKGDPSLVEDPTKDRQYAEQAVDVMRAQKDEELERYRKTSERRAKETFNKPLVEGYA